MKEALAGKGPGGGKAAGGISKTGTMQKDFRIEVAKAGGAGCRVCEVKIKKVRQAKKSSGWLCFLGANLN